MTALMLHAGGRAASYADLTKVTTPPRTKTHLPVPHHEVADEVKAELGAMGMVVKAERYGLRGKDGAQMFGVLEVEDKLGATPPLDTPLGDRLATLAPAPSYAGLIVGVRNSHDLSMKLSVCAGTRVFVCDNMSFNGDVVRHRKHTSGIVAATVIRGALSKVVDQGRRELAWLDKLREPTFETTRAKATLVDCLREGACTTTQFPKIVDLFLEGTWSGYDAAIGWTPYAMLQCFTEVWRGPLDDQGEHPFKPHDALRRSQRLNRVLGKIVARDMGV